MEEVIVPLERLYARVETYFRITETINESQNEGRGIIEELKDLKDALIKYGKEIKETINSLENNLGCVTALEEKARTLEENEKQYIQQIAELEGEIFEQDKKIDHLKNEVKELKTGLQATQGELAGLRNSLQTGQTAFEFERDLATYIYPNGKKFGYQKIFTNLKDWLEMEKETPQGRKANKKWDDLQKKTFSWTDEHEKVFFKLLDFRKKFAHPLVDREAIKTQIPDDFNDEEKKCIQDIIRMTEKVNELMKAEGNLED
ncbi:uncharacterized protein LOC114537951 [Dendronephthya gigantea]|uniref:uncharacterized protein LOC114537951 n=1 Tax=Dendronephthya gigantea TaxID=151771 RepID=UPI00106B45C6|nr:uncharacterized protein LOC114537951 [Dendronephthya gigantea]